MDAAEIQTLAARAQLAGDYERAIALLQEAADRSLTESGRAVLMERIEELRQLVH